MLQSRKGKPFGGIASFAATHCSASEVQARLAGQVLLNYVRACWQHPTPPREAET